MVWFKNMLFPPHSLFQEANLACYNNNNMDINSDNKINDNIENKII